MKSKISPIYSAVQKTGGKRPIIGRPSDEPKQYKVSDVIAQSDVFLIDGMIRAQKIHKNQYGCFIRLGGHEIKVVSLGSVWHQKGFDLVNLPLEYHPREVANIKSTPVKICLDFTRLAPNRQYKNDKGDLINIYPSKQKGLKGETRNLAKEPKLEGITPHYRLPKEGVGGQSKEELAKITKLAKVTPEMESWLKTIGK